MSPYQQNVVDVQKAEAMRDAQKQLMGDDGYQTTYCDSNKQYWQLRLKHSSLNWIVFKDGVPVVKQSFKLVSKEVLKDEKGIKNIVEYTIIDESKLKSICLSL